MAMAAFFPWLKIDDEIEFDDFNIVPAKSVTSANHGSKNSIDFVLKPYINHQGLPINEAVFLFLKIKDLFKDLDEGERAYLFLIAEILAFCSLSSRSYFGISNYCNRDNFTLIIQSFDGTNGFTVNTRRRDGHSISSYSGNTFSAKAPFHVDLNYTLFFDENLAKALFNAEKNMSENKWQNIYAAIFNYNHSNTDDYQISEQQELVMLLGAFQRLLDCSSAKADELAKAFLAKTIPSEEIKICISKKLSTKTHNYRSLREAWIKDAYALRGQYAHGKHKTQMHTYWNRQEHLLLGAFVFPLLLKIVLSKENFYEITDYDKTNINAFESLLDADIFNPPKDQKNSLDWEWNRILNNSYESKYAKEIVRVFLEKKGSQEQDNR
ncbi:MAG: hypothetical protein WCW67_04980 [Candidatus Margulisiibacteriota bacterium]|jgi:hypothetical protein